MVSTGWQPVNYKYPKYHAMKDLFLKLVKISSPSGHESEMAGLVSDRLRGLGWKVENDLFGNVSAKLPGRARRVLLVAHMDTVQRAGERINPTDEDGTFKSDGATILGADNKAGVAVLLKVAEDLGSLAERPTVWLAFTVREEAGEMGSAKLDVKVMDPEVIVNVDGGKTPGVVDYRALGQRVFEITVIGRAAHAAMEPEKGVHAIRLAAEMVGRLRMGRQSNGDTLNIGRISGGEATNVIPNQVVVVGEMRSFSELRMVRTWGKMQGMASKVAKKYGGTAVVKELGGVGAPAWSGRQLKTWTKIFKRAATRSGVKFVYSQMLASSDANCLAKHGIPTFSLNRGGKNPHSVSESITLKELEDTKRFIMAILNQV